MKLNGKRIFVCLLFFAFLILLTNATYAAVDFSLNQSSVILQDGSSFEFQIRISDIDAEARSFSGSMNFDDGKIRLDSISGLGSNWQLEGRNLSLGTFYMTRVNDTAASSNEAVIKVTGTVLASECEENISIINLRYVDVNDVYLTVNKGLVYLVKKIKTVDINVPDNEYQSGNNGEGSSIIDIIGNYGSSQGNENENNNSGSLIPEDNQNTNDNTNTENNDNSNNTNNQAENNNEWQDVPSENNGNTNQTNTQQNTNRAGNTNNSGSGSNTGKTTNTGTVKKDSTVTPAEKAPQTGSGKFVVIALISVAVIGSICYVGFRKNSF